MVNRYSPRSKLTDKQFEALIWAVCSLQSVDEAAKTASVSRRSAAEHMRRVRTMIAGNETLLNKAALPKLWPDEDDPIWERLHHCALNCPSEVREPMKVFDWNATALKGNRSLCTACPFMADMIARPLFLRTLHRLQNEWRGISIPGFKGVFVTALIYDSYRQIEVDQALKNEEAMKRLGSTPHNFMTLLFEDAKAALWEQAKQRL